MKNLMKAQLYQLLKGKKMIILTIIAVLFMQLVGVLSPLLDGMNTVTFGILLTTYSDVGNSLIIFSYAAAAGVIVAIICTGGDFRDKTINYEIMNGYTRFEIFVAKSFVSIMAGLVTYVIVLFITYATGIVLWGFGTELNFADVCLRLFSSLFVEIRLICIFITITYLIRIFWVGIIIAGTYFVIAPEAFGGVGKNSYLLGVTTFGRLSEYVSWISYTLSEEVEYIYVYGRRLAAGECITTVLTSLGIGFVALFIGYFFFKKDDLH